MKFLQRIEVWVLLLLAAGAAVWVLTSRPSGADDGDPEAITEGAAAQPAIVIHRTTLERDFGNARLDLELRYRNASPRTLILQSPDVRLITAEGQEVPPFILPMEKPPQISPQTAQDVRLRYWLDKKHLQGPLTLDIRGATAEVKGPAPLDLDKLENKKPKTWTGPVR
ncbi:MAG TPA: hypothetical protein VD994_15420 [Prosthecobacter sp.]|nr:hypothetical protein [Prosthecobacter sp.]